MKVLFVPKQQAGFHWEDPNIKYTGGRIFLPFLHADVAEFDVDTSFDLTKIEYKELSDEDASRTIKFFMNYSGYIKVTQGTENSTLEITSSREEIAGILTKVKYYLTDEDKAKAFTFTKENILWAINVRVNKVAENLDDFNRSEYETIANSVKQKVIDATEMKQMFVIAHKYFGMEAPDAIVEEYNLSAPTLVI